MILFSRLFILQNISSQQLLIARKILTKIVCGYILTPLSAWLDQSHEICVEKVVCTSPINLWNEGSSHVFPVIKSYKTHTRILTLSGILFNKSIQQGNHVFAQTTIPSFWPHSRTAEKSFQLWNYGSLIKLTKLSNELIYSQLFNVVNVINKNKIII